MLIKYICKAYPLLINSYEIVNNRQPVCLDYFTLALAIILFDLVYE